jgi:predicted ester cyclase
LDAVEKFFTADYVAHAEAWQRTLHGTHKSNMMGIPPSEKKIQRNEMVVSRCEGDKYARTQ